MTDAADGGVADGDTIFSSGGELIDVASAEWQRIPTAALKALLAERQAGGERPPCGSGEVGHHYNTSLHVFALFLILFLSTAACAFPIVVRRFPQLAVPPRVLFLSRHFGTGVLIATAFVHLLPTAFVSLTDQCLPPFFNDSYPALPGAIAMTSVLLVVGVEMFFASRGARHVHGTEFEEYMDPRDSSMRNGNPRPQGVKRFQRGSLERLPDIHVPQDDDTAETARLVHNRTPTLAEPSPHPPDEHAQRRDGEERSYRDLPPDEEEEDSELELDELDPMPAASASHSRQSSYQPLHRHKRGSRHDSHVPLGSGLSSSAQQQRLLLQCLLLEAGILFHSIFIGMALSVSQGASFVVFLIAIAFHQTFEGLALGARIAAISFPHRSPKPWLMALAFGATTPLGQAIGLGIHNLYDPQSQTGLIVVGATNAVSSGLLLFAGLVALLAEDFLSEESYVTLVGRRRLEACAAVVLGSVLMALVGAWA